MCERKPFALIIDIDTILMMLEFATEVNLMISMRETGTFIWSPI
jgi:hypothetical protein